MGTASSGMSAAQQAQLQNAQARALISSNATDVRQIIYQNTVANPASSPLNIPVRPVGLVLGFWVEITATVANPAGAAITPTDLGGTNIVSQFSFVDLNNFTRIQTTGAHVAQINTVRQRSPYGSALFSPGNKGGSQATIGFDNPMSLGSNWNVWQSTASIAASGNGTIKVLYYVPLAYSKKDLRGAIYAGVINATMQLGVTFNAFPSVAAGADSTNAVYVGNAGASISSATITVTQHYLDQLPLAKNGYPVLPTIDTNTVYELKNTFLTGLANGQDFAVPYTNYRDFLSVFLIYNDGTSTNGGRPALTSGVASNLNYVAVQTANFFNPIKNTPYLQAALYRNVVGTDLPPGMYYFPSRDKPVSTTQAGNQQLILNPANLGSTQTPYVQAYFEDFGVIAALTQAGSLASN